MGSGPFGQSPGGHFNFDVPSQVTYVEPFPRRVRAVKDDETVVDSDRTVLVFESRRMPHYAFPTEDVAFDRARPEPAVAGHVRVAWDAVDAWFEEDEQVYVHVRDPYHRIDVVPTHRHVVISLDGPDGAVVSPTRRRRAPSMRPGCRCVGTYPPRMSGPNCSKPVQP